MAGLLQNKLALILVGLMFLEAIGLTLFFTFAGAEEGVAAETQATVEGRSTSLDDYVEHELGTFRVSNNGLEGTPLRVDLTVFAEIPKDQEGEFLEIYPEREYRVKEAIQTVVRRASYTELTEPDLATIKRMLLKAIAGILGTERTMISRVIVPEYQVYEI